MKTILLCATSAFFLLGNSFAHEVASESVVTTHKLIVEHRIVQLNRKTGASCSTNYTTTAVDGVSGPTRKSVDCEE